MKRSKRSLAVMLLAVFLMSCAIVPPPVAQTPTLTIQGVNVPLDPDQTIPDDNYTTCFRIPVGQTDYKGYVLESAEDADRDLGEPRVCVKVSQGGIALVNVTQVRIKAVAPQDYNFRMVVKGANATTKSYRIGATLSGVFKRGRRAASGNVVHVKVTSHEPPPNMPAPKSVEAQYKIPNPLQANFGLTTGEKTVDPCANWDGSACKDVQITQVDATFRRRDVLTLSGSLHIATCSEKGECLEDLEKRLR